MNAPVLFSLLVLLSACGWVPRPFMPDGGDPENALLTLRDGGGVAVAPPLGMETATGHRFAEAVVAALHDRDVAAAVGEGAAGSHLLSAQVSFRRDGRGVRIARFVWDLSDPDGNGLATVDYAQPAPPGDWAGVRAADLAGLVEPVAERVLAAVRENHGRIVDIAPPAIVLIAFSGAPGDGDAALRAAAARALSDRGVNVFYELTDDIAVLSATAWVRPPTRQPDPARPVERVGIDWVLMRADGGEIARMSQENTVPAGSLDREWGAVAMLAAQAAIDAIVPLLPDS